VSDYWWYWQRLRKQLKRVLELSETLVTKPEKCSYCAFCEFSADCYSQWRQEDSLVFLKDGNKSYREALSEVGVDTLTGLALLPQKDLEDLLRENMEEGDEITEEEVLEAVRNFSNDDIEADFESAIQKWENNPDCDVETLVEKWSRKPPDINVDQFVKLWRQARLQKIAEQTNKIHVHSFSEKDMAEKMKEKEEGWKRGECLLHLPELNDHDIYLDFEGHPFWQIEQGLIFLFGYLEKREGEWEYVAIWAHDKDEEKEKATELVDFFHDRFKNHPDMHVYHYNHTERVVLADLLNSDDDPMSSILNVFGHAIGQSPADMRHLNELVDEGVFVDLLAIVRNSLQAGTESFSLKVMERLAGFERDENIQKGAEAVLEYELYANADLYGIEKDEERLNGIAQYNKDDVEATYELHKWLLQQRNNNPNLPDETLPIPEEDFERSNTDDVEAIARLQDQIVEKIRGERNGN
jgi:predicted RecB family nuclease